MISIALKARAYVKALDDLEAGRSWIAKFNKVDWTTSGLSITWTAASAEPGYDVLSKCIREQVRNNMDVMLKEALLGLEHRVRVTRREMLDAEQMAEHGLARAGDA